MSTFFRFIWMIIGVVVVGGGYLYLRLKAGAKKQTPLDRENSPDIYGASADGRFYSPFNLAIDPMEKIFLVNLVESPVYEGIELQTIDDEVKGKGTVVIMYRREGVVDFYYEPGVRPNREQAAVLLDIDEWIESEIESRFDVTPNGMDLFCKFEDKFGQMVEFAINEHRPNKRRFDLVAPISSAAKAAPKYFLLVFLRDISLIERPGTRITIKIGGEERQPMKLPMILPMTGTFAYFSRYSDAPVLAMWNEAYTGELPSFRPDRPGELRTDNTVYDLVENAGHYEIAKLSAFSAKHTAHITFSPPVPDVISLKDGVEVEGRFVLGVDEVEGVIAGEYSARRDGDRVRLHVQPTENWQPQGGILVKLTLMFFPPVFRTWPKTYRWSADVALDDVPKIQASWARVED